METQLATDHPSCKTILAYNGTKDTTISGKTCQKWNQQSPHNHSNTDPAYFPNRDVDNNFCRNPSLRDGPWCYTTDPDIPWEYCFFFKGTVLFDNCCDTKKVAFVTM